MCIFTFIRLWFWLTGRRPSSEMRTSGVHRAIELHRIGFFAVSGVCVFDVCVCFFLTRFRSAVCACGHVCLIRQISSWRPPHATNDPNVIAIEQTYGNLTTLEHGQLDNADELEHTIFCENSGWIFREIWTDSRMLLWYLQYKCPYSISIRTVRMAHKRTQS